MDGEPDLERGGVAAVAEKRLDRRELARREHHVPAPLTIEHDIDAAARALGREPVRRPVLPERHERERRAGGRATHGTGPST